MILATLVVRTVVLGGVWDVYGRGGRVWIGWIRDVGRLWGERGGKGGKGSGRREGGCGQYTQLNKQEKPRYRECWVGKGSEIGAFDLE